MASGGSLVASGVIEGATVLMIFLLLGSFVAWVPIAALAGILLAVAARMFDVKMFSLLAAKSTRIDFLVIVVVVGVAEGVGLIEASLVGVVLAILLFIRDQTKASVVLRKANLSVVRSTRRRPREETAILERSGSLGVFVQLRGNLFFGTTDQLFTDLESELTTCRFVLLDLRRIGSIDYTAANLLKQMEARLSERQGELLLAGMPTTAPTGIGIEEYLRGLGLVNDHGGIRVFATRDSALEWMEDAILAASDLEPRQDQELQLEAVPLFAALPPASLARLRSIARPSRAQAGQRIFSAGDLDDDLFVVRSGRVHVLLPLDRGVRHHVATIGAGEFFGELTFLDGTARTADAEAAVETSLFVISRKDFDGLLGSDPGVAGHVYREIARAIAGRLRTADSELRTLEVR